jgi:NADH-quinone oxidoreductase subunit D
MTELTEKEVFFDEMTLNMGPHHPSTHGVLKFVLRTDGEILKTAIPDVGFLHRSIEKIAEGLPYPQFFPYTDRVDYLAAMNANHAYAVAVEKLLGIEVPPRAEYIRVLVAEINRIASHMVGVGALASDLGAFTPFLFNLRDREYLYDYLEEMCGARLTYNYLTIGGIHRDLKPETADKIMKFVAQGRKNLDEFNRLISKNKIFIRRLAGVGVVDQKTCIEYGLVGPNIRGAGLKFDIRKDEPYSVYDKLNFEIPVGKAYAKEDGGVLGDAYDRFMVRILEMEQSYNLIEQVLKEMPEGEIQAKVPKKLKPPVGDIYVPTESARGEMGYYIFSDGTDQPWRLKIRTGSFSAMSSFEEISNGYFIADLVSVIGSFDIVAPEVAR